MDNPHDSEFFEIGPFSFIIGKFCDWPGRSHLYYFDRPDICLDIDIDRGFKTPANAEAYALKQVKKLYKQLEEVL